MTLTAWGASFSCAMPMASPSPRLTLVPACPVEQVVGRLLGVREAAETVGLTERPEAVLAPREHLVRIRLMGDVPHQLVPLEVEDPVQRDGQLHDPEVRPEVPAGLLDRVEEEIAHLAAQLRQIGALQGLHIGRSLDAVEQPCAAGLFRLRHGSSRRG